MTSGTSARKGVEFRGGRLEPPKGVRDNRSAEPAGMSVAAPGGVPEGVGTMPTTREFESSSRHLPLRLRSGQIMIN